MILKSEKSDAAALLALIASLEPEIGAAFLRAVEDLRGRVRVRDAVELIAQGRVAEAVAAALPDAAITDALEPVPQAITGSVNAAGQAAAAAAPALRAAAQEALTVRWSPVNPYTVARLRDYELRWLHGMNASIKQTAEAAIRTGIKDGQNPLTIARTIPRSIGLSPPQEVAALNYERALREGRMADARRYATRDRRFGHATPPDDAQIVRMVQRYRDRALKLRRETIARTEAARAVSVGNHELWVQQVEAGKIAEADVRRKWVYTADSKVRHAHRSIPSLNPKGVGLKQPFQSELGPILYPGDPDATPANTINCRCTVIMRLSPSAVARKPPEPAKPPPDPLNLKAKDAAEVPWHEAAWAAAPKPMQDAIARAPATDVARGTLPGAREKRTAFQSTLTGYARPKWAEGKTRDHFIYMEDFDPSTSAGQAVWRHEYGHHLDKLEGGGHGGAGPRSVAAAAEVRDDAKLILEMQARLEAADDPVQDEYSALRRKRLAAGGGLRPERSAAFLDDELKASGINLRVTDFADRPMPTNDPQQAYAWHDDTQVRAMKFLAGVRAGAPRYLLDRVAGHGAVGGYDIMVQDFFGSMTLNKVGRGHTDEYYRERRGSNPAGVGEGQLMEAFANFVAIMGSDSRVKQELLRILAPQTVEAFSRIIGDLAVGKGI